MLRLLRLNARRTKGDLDGAISDYTKAISLSPKFTRAYYNRGAAYQARGDLSWAIADYDSAIRDDPEFIDAYVNRAQVKLLLKDTAGAIQDYNKAVDLKPDSGDDPGLKPSYKSFIQNRRRSQ